MANKLPDSYTTLSFAQIKLSHVPASSPTPTPVILLTLYRPGKHNAFTETMVQDLTRAFTLLSADPRVRAIVVTGHGSMFCAGADLDSGKGLTFNDTVETHRDGGGQVTLAIYRCQKPVIAAINGHAVGVGLTMTLPMSIRIASEDAKVGMVFARRGIVMEAISSFFLPKLIGFSRATHLVTTGSVYEATDPLLRELFSEVLPKEKVLKRALELADGIAKNTSGMSTQLMKDMMWRNPGTPEETHLLDSRILIELFNGKDKKEGIDSFLEKRDPKFTGTMEDDAPKAWPWWKDVDVGVPWEKSKL
ncbi:ClpP/crotonase-like domain-containing protein [Calycina marina]|uniref:ClpP/crotonase-like domain-containing protein n=1 Tax=Calycina marina TaxID=1763456 RepID=A0A9P7Z0F6_9HELO|nr:ClpP/crotonase-like domain-containing protein [Calycina marina]